MIWTSPFSDEESDDDIDYLFVNDLEEIYTHEIQKQK